MCLICAGADYFEQVNALYERITLSIKPSRSLRLMLPLGGRNLVRDS